MQKAIHFNMVLRQILLRYMQNFFLVKLSDFTTGKTHPFIYAAWMLKRLLTAATGTYYLRNCTTKSLFQFQLFMFSSHYSEAKVVYDGCMSNSFKVSQGVQQGSILSPHLYNIYTESLLKDIQQNCKKETSIHGHYTGITMYADDIILMSTTLSGIQHLANKCTEYNNSNAICFNSDKTELLVSGHA